MAKFQNSTFYTFNFCSAINLTSTLKKLPQLLTKQHSIVTFNHHQLSHPLLKPPQKTHIFLSKINSNPFFLPQTTKRKVSLHTTIVLEQQKEVRQIKIEINSWLFLKTPKDTTHKIESSLSLFTIWERLLPEFSTRQMSFALHNSINNNRLFSLSWMIIALRQLSLATLAALRRTTTTTTNKKFSSIFFLTAILLYKFSFAVRKFYL